jgi:hypothetical protein
MRHIERDGYHLFDWPEREQLSLVDCWCAVPELVLGRFLVSTSFDSGSLCLTAAQLDAGWKVVGRLAHSPKITALSEIPHDQFDEWLAFDSPVEVPEFDTMVNYTHFSPIDFDWIEKLEIYWQQILRFRPRHVLAENYRVYVITSDEAAARKLQTI